MGSLRCMKCGRDIESEDEEFCNDCSRLTRTYIRGFPLFKYAWPVNDSIMEMKYAGKQEHATFYGEELSEHFGETFRTLGMEAIIPVPLHKKKLLKRGYNQAQLLAEVVGKRLNIPVRTDVIIRKVNTTPQNELSGTQRLDNIKHAFAPNPDYIKKKSREGRALNTVLLLDDIYTTGATIQACTDVCHAVGIKNMYYTSPCIAEE